MSAIGVDTGRLQQQRVETAFVSATLALARKDALVEARGRETLPPMLAFSVAVTLLLAFALPGDAGIRTEVVVPFGTVAISDVLAAFLWVTILFAGLIGFARTFEIERTDDALAILVLAPVDRAAIFTSKALMNVSLLVVLEAVLVPVFAVLFGLDLGIRWLVLILVVALVDIGFVTIGTLFSAMAAQTRSRELMLPVLALPAVVPAFIAAVELTGDLFAGGGLDVVAARGWFAILVAFDIVFAVIGALAFEFVIER